MTNKQTALAPYASKDEIKALATRAQSTLLLPGGKQLPTSAAYALAQIALAHGLDPWNGEIWPIPDGKGGFSTMIGIKGLRKAAKREAKQDGSVFWGNLTRVQPEKYGAAENAVVYEYDLRDTATSRAWADAIKVCVDAGMPYTEAKQAVGEAPRAIGVGIATPDERSKMAIHARARKRAEADAIKQRYGVEFVGADFSPEDPDDMVDAEFIDQPDPEFPVTIEDETPVDPEPEEKKTEQQILAELGFETQGGE